ncbi:type VI secretion system tube protein TssD, partial [Pseudomonas aeruginosa]
MATPAYMSITGTKQGLITAGAFTEDSVGNTYQEGHEDQVMVQGFNHEVIIPRDPQSGQPTGQRVHKPVVITKVFDKASPLLLAALTSGEPKMSATSRNRHRAKDFRRRLSKSNVACSSNGLERNCPPG